MRVIFFDDYADHLRHIASHLRVALQRGGVSAEVITYKSDWLRHAEEQATEAGPQVWLIDIKTDTPHQPGKGDLQEWMDEQLDKDPRLRELYTGAFGRYSHTGLGLAIMAKQRGIRCVAISHVTSEGHKLLSYLMTDDSDQNASKFSFQKGLLLSDVPERPDVKAEYDRLVGFIRTASMQGSRTNVAATGASWGQTTTPLVSGDQVIMPHSEELPKASPPVDPVGGPKGGARSPKQKLAIVALLAAIGGAILYLGAAAEIVSAVRDITAADPPLLITRFDVTEVRSGANPSRFDVLADLASERTVGDRLEIHVQTSEKARIDVIALNCDSTVSRIAEGDGSADAVTCEHVLSHRGFHAIVAIAKRRGSIPLVGRASSVEAWVNTFKARWFAAAATGVWVCDGPKGIRKSAGNEDIAAAQLAGKVCEAIEDGRSHGTIDSGRAVAFSVTDASVQNVR